MSDFKAMSVKQLLAAKAKNANAKDKAMAGFKATASKINTVLEEKVATELAATTVAGMSPAEKQALVAELAKGS